jgi:coniferyl-aldehyde dehydrogenase
MQDVAFGGVGESGMGRYLAFDGFKTMSNAKGFAQRPWFDVTKYIAPPYGPGLANAMRKALRF